MYSYNCDYNVKGMILLLLGEEEDEVAGHVERRDKDCLPRMVSVRQKGSKTVLEVA